MFLRTEQEVKYYMRRSKGGKHHTYKRMRTIVVFQCDDCKEEFKRDKGKVFEFDDLRGFLLIS